MRASAPLALAASIAAALVPASTPGFAARAQAPPTVGIERPSILQAQDLAHRNDHLNLPPAAASPRTSAPAPLAATRTGYNAAGLQREVLGFATYWELASGNLSDVQWDKVSTVTYFGLTLNGGGGFDNDAGMTGWNSADLTSMIVAARAQGDKVVVTIKSFSDASINPVVTNPAIAQAAINNIINAVRARGLDGVNIDFEGTTSPSYPNIQTDFTNWVASLTQQMHTSVPGSFVTLDSYSGSASWDGGFMRIDTLAPHVDAFFIMAYDMTAPNDLPNAPLAGPYTYTDTTSVDQYLAKVGGNGAKVILGVPYYGYKFSTSSPDFNAPVTGGQGTPAYSDVQSDIQCASGAPDNLAYHWDGPSSTPWLSWFSPSSADPCGGNHGSWRETYYDDARSLGAKYDLVNQRNIRGVGMWALGYDHGYGELWQAIAQHFGGARWADWWRLGGASPGHTALGTNADGRLEAFMRGTDGAIWHAWQIAPNNGWTTWYSLGGNFTGDPQLATNSDGRLEAAAVGTDGRLWHSWQVAPNNGWTAWYAMGGALAGMPAIASNRDGRLEVFVRGTDNVVWHAWQVAPNNGWTQLYPMGGATASDPAVATNPDGRLEVFARGPDNAAWHSWQVAAGSGWTQWYSLGGILSGTPAAAANADGRLEVFALGTDGALWHIWQIAAGTGWNQFGSLGGTLASGPSIGRNADGRLEVFALDASGHVGHIWQLAPSSGWVPWSTLGTFVAGSIPGVGANADGRLELFARASDNAVWHNWQTILNGGW